MPGWIIGLAAALFALLAAPGLTWLDAGELGAAAAELGVAHPPGFALFALIHKGVMLLLPLGDVAFRGNLASGALGAVAVGATVQTALTLGARPRSAMLGGALLALSPLFILHAATIEVYTGAAAWTGLVAWALARAARDQDARWAVAVAFGVGLALGHHAELRLFVVLLVPAAIWRGWAHRRAALAAAVAGLSGALVALYLPLRAASMPWRNWGDPVTAERLWNHLMGTRIRLAYAEQFGHFDPDAFATFGGQLWSAAPALVLVGLVGLVLAVRKPGGWWLPLVWAVDVLYAAALNPMGLKDLQNGVPGLLALAVGAGLAFDRLPRRAALPVGALAVGLSLWIGGGRVLAPHGDRGLPLVLDAIADGAPPEALVAVASDSYAAGLAFRQVVEGDRPDLAVLVRQHAWDASSVAPVIRRVPHALRGWQPGASLAGLATLGSAWPVWWEWSAGNDAALRPDLLGPSWPFFARAAPDEGQFERRLVALVETLGGAGLAEPQARRALAVLASDLGLYRAHGARWPAAVGAFEAAATIQPEAANRWTNLSQAQLRAGQGPEALESARRAWDLAFGGLSEGTNFARILVSTNVNAEAMVVLDTLIALHPEAADCWALRGVARANQGDLMGAAADFDAAVELEPAQPEANAGLRQLQRMRR
jgi:hypothetical protein